MKRFFIIGIIIFICIFGVCIYCAPNKRAKSIYDDLLKYDDYRAYKKMYSDVKTKEYAIRDKIIIKTNNGELKNKFKFKIDDEYISFKCNSDFILDGLEYFEFVIDVIADSYHMDKKYVRLYINSMIENNTSSDYFIIEEDGKYTTYKYYIKKKFKVPSLDDLYIKEGDLLDSLDVIDDGFYYDVGKITAYVSRNEEKVITIVVSEYGDNTDLTYKSIINSVKDIKPKHYQEFLEKFTELKELSSMDGGYFLEVLTDEEAKSLFYYEENNRYVRVVFNKN